MTDCSKWSAFEPKPNQTLAPTSFNHLSPEERATLDLCLRNSDSTINYLAEVKSRKPRRRDPFERLQRDDVKLVNPELEVAFKQVTKLCVILYFITVVTRVHGSNYFNSIATIAPHSMAPFAKRWKSPVEHPIAKMSTASTMNLTLVSLFYLQMTHDKRDRTSVPILSATLCSFGRRARSHRFWIASVCSFNSSGPSIK